MGMKKVRFDYFKVNGRWFDAQQNRVVEGFFELSPILEAVEGVDIRDRTYAFNNESSRLQGATNIDGLWSIHLVRIRKDDIPSITSDDGDLDPLDLTEDQGIGEEVTALYDPSNHVIMIQRNKYSLSPTGIASYFNTACGDENTHIYLSPIVSPDALQRIDETDLFRGIEVTIADLKNASNETKQSLSGITSKAENTSAAVNVRITMSLDKRSKKSDSISDMFNLLRSFSRDSNVKKMEVRKKDDENTPVEKFDLIEDRLNDHGYFKVDRENQLSHTVVTGKMLDLYHARKEYIDDITR